MLRLTVIVLCPLLCLCEILTIPANYNISMAKPTAPDPFKMPEYLSQSDAPGSTLQLSWKITKFPTVLKYDRDSDRENVIEAANWAFSLYSSVANLDFYQTDSDHPDIELRFELPVEHDEKCPNGAFEGSSSYAVAHYVLGSKNPAVLHFNDEFHWSMRDFKGRQSIKSVKPLKNIFAHEIGHALGLQHTNMTDSIMDGSENTLATSLNLADKVAIMMRYGRKIAPKPTVSTAAGNCHSTVTKVSTNSDGQTYAVCAVLYDKTGCDGDSFAMGVGYLSLVEYRKNNGRKWADTVSSMQINPNCSIDLCIYDKLDNCRNYRGGLLGNNTEKVDFRYDNNVWSMYCACEFGSEFPSENLTTISHFTTKLAKTTNFGCPKTIARLSKYDSGRIFNVCAIAYDKFYCGGKSLTFPMGQGELSEIDWNKTISSIQVNPGCSMKLCTFPGLTGNCGTVDANSGIFTVESMPSKYDNKVESFVCQCLSTSTTSSTTSTVTSSTGTEQSPSYSSEMSSTPPRSLITETPTTSNSTADSYSTAEATTTTTEFPFDNATTASRFTTKMTPTTNLGCPKVLEKQWKSSNTGEIFYVCAVGYNQSYCGGERLFFPVGQWELGRYEWNNTISSLQINPGCSMKLCTLPNLTGTCGMVPANNTMSTFTSLNSHYDNKVESVDCRC